MDIREMIMDFYFIGFVIIFSLVFIGEEGTIGYRTYQALKYGLWSWLLVILVCAICLRHFFDNNRLLSDLDERIKSWLL